MTTSILIPDSINPVIAFGVHDTHLRTLEKILSVKLYPRESEVIIEGTQEQLNQSARVLHKLLFLARGETPISHDEIKIIIEDTLKGESLSPELLISKGIRVSKKGTKIKPRNRTQLDYMNKILNHDLTFCVGPAGTGKTYLAVALALNALVCGETQKIILTRPVVEAGENLGFLPGTLEDKIDPYVRPLYDAIYDMLSIDEFQYYSENLTLEVAPLAYMRGRTLNNAYVILDEAQNTSVTQMKMFLTRLGEHSKMIITGDISQIDLPINRKSGLKQAVEIFVGTEGIAFHSFEKEDVVRHGLVKKIIETYEKLEQKEWQKTND